VEWVTTTTILEKLRDHADRGAWERLVERFRRPIASFVREMGVAPADCEDVTQSTLLAFAEGIRDGKYDRARGRLSRWLFGIAYRQAMRQLRGSARDPARPSPEEERGAAAAERLPAPEETAAAETWDRLWEEHVVETSIARARAEFSGEIFRAFELTVLEEKPAAEAAAALGVPVKAVYNAKHRVLKRVREIAAAMEDAGEGEHAVPGS
jgi:RNA polymerase sigma-70 factor (ECF subfamily)